MIQLTRLNGNPLLLNSDLIKTAEASPDTMLTLINGEKLIVREKLADVVQRVLAYRAALLAEVAGRLESTHTLLRAASLSSLQFDDAPGPQSSRDSLTEEDDQ
jgi:flagellar protein FlbD